MSLGNFIQNLIPWALARGIRIIVILVFAWLTTRIGKAIISRLIKTLIKRSDQVGKNGKIQKERGKTLLKVFGSTFKAIVWVIAILMILPEFGVNVAPLLAGAGLVGLAIGLGARNLIQDYLSGLFILLEDQYRVGEEVEISGIKGRVINLSLRRTVLKNSEGVIHHIPNGQITKASNFSRK